MQRALTRWPRFLLSSCLPLMMGAWLGCSAQAEEPGTPSTSDAQASGDRDVTPMSPVGRCPFPGTYFPVFLPDSHRCDVFYECSAGVPIQLHCAPGTVFNPKIDVCDWPSNVDCPED